jgi:ATP-binding cassette subfamily C (CFTR/MRP) protein 1
MTVVGSKGISLNGGQKSRLALAWVVFARRDVLILDDVFSGIDADTEEHIFRKLFESPVSYTAMIPLFFSSPML